MKCPNCGFETDEKFCSKCGTEIKEQFIIEQENNKPFIEPNTVESKKSTSIDWSKYKIPIFAIVAVLVFIGIALLSQANVNITSKNVKKPDKINLDFYDSFTKRDVSFCYDKENWTLEDTLSDSESDPIAYSCGDFLIYYSANITTDTLFKEFCESIETDESYTNVKKHDTELYGLNVANYSYNYKDDFGEINYVNEYFFEYEYNLYEIDISCSDYNKSSADDLMEHISSYTLLKAPTYWDSIINE